MYIYLSIYKCMQNICIYSMACPEVFRHTGTCTKSGLRETVTHPAAPYQNVDGHLLDQIS